MYTVTCMIGESPCSSKTKDSMVQYEKSIKSYRCNTVSKWSTGLGALMLAASCQFATAATVCVSQGGSCAFTTISAAVKAASPGDTIQVQPGIYNESVSITQSLALVGTSRDSTIINAFGLPNGIFIDGTAKAPASGISNVIVSGFTVENANFEGILVANATAVTILGNQISGNNRSLNTTSLTCPNLPAFETNEAEDCGEGLHLMAVDHSIVANNIVKNNSGGILISDETGPTHDNLITGNTVTNNPYDCGITLASHAPSPTTNLKLPAGIYHNTISGNTSTNNGLQTPGAGAGVGIFAPGPGNQNWGNVVINNTLTGNGMPGVAMHNHASFPNAPAANLNDNMIVGNVISGNAADVEDAATPGPTGINIYSVGPVTGTVIALNVVRNETVGVAVNTPAADVRVQLNNLQAPTGVDNIGAGSINAVQNYWGCASGPGQNGCGGVIGMVLTASAAVIPF
jgi:nitrous oxidase accessory protein NosD